jgi:hypothetical protein
MVHVWQTEICGSIEASQNGAMYKREGALSVDSCPIFSFTFRSVIMTKYVLFLPSIFLFCPDVLLADPDIL